MLKIWSQRFVLVVKKESWSYSKTESRCSRFGAWTQLGQTKLEVTTQTFQFFIKLKCKLRLGNWLPPIILSLVPLPSARRPASRTQPLLPKEADLPLP